MIDGIRFRYFRYNCPHFHFKIFEEKIIQIPIHRIVRHDWSYYNYVQKNIFLLKRFVLEKLVLNVPAHIYFTYVFPQDTYSYTYTSFCCWSQIFASSDYYKIIVRISKFSTLFMRNFYHLLNPKFSQFRTARTNFEL